MVLVPIGIGRARSAQRAMAARLGTIERHGISLFVSQRLFFHVSKVVGAGLVTGLAPARAAALAAVVVHAHRTAGGGGVASVAFHRCASEELGFWDVIGGLAAGALTHEAAVMADLALAGNADIDVETSARPGGIRFVTSIAIGNRHAGQRLIGDMRSRPSISGRIGATVAIGALGSDSHLGVVELRGLPTIGGVTGDAVGGAHRNMGAGLASGTAAVMAAGAIGGHREGGVAHLGCCPAAGVGVATLTHGLAGVNGVVGLAGGVAGCALH